MKHFVILLLALSCASTPEQFRFKPPIYKGRISSTIGGRWGRLHLGVDIACPKWTPVKVSAKGTVTGILKRDKIFGNRVEVYHSDIGLYSSYSHLQEIHVVVGQRLRGTEIIGLAGSTGKSTGNHLHFEIYNVNGVYLNPIGLLESHGYSYKYKK